MRGTLGDRLFWVWIVCLVVGLVLAIAARGAGPLPGDVVVSRLVQQLTQPYGRTGEIIGAADKAVWFLPPLLIGGALALRRWRAALFMLIVAVVAFVAAEVVLSNIVARPRPAADLIPVYEAKSDYSFPSGSALVAMMLFGAGSFLVRGTRQDTHRKSDPLAVSAIVLSVILTLAFGIARVAMGAHWFSDIIGAWLWGAALLLPLVAYYRTAGLRR